MDEWKEAFHRVCVVEEYRDLNRPHAVGDDGVDWSAESVKFDAEANARAILDDDKVREWNDHSKLAELIISKYDNG